jgi:hypothetical protein
VEDGEKGKERGGHDKNGSNAPDDRKQHNKPKYKPKNEEEEEKAHNKKDSSHSKSSNEEEQIVRKFKKEEVRELIQDGYIVVGKNKGKPKPKDQK